MNKRLLSIMFFAALTTSPQLALAAGGSGSSVTGVFEQILDVTKSVSPVVGTLALVWAGYKVMWMGVAIREIAGPLMGALLIVAAPWLIDVLMSNI